MAGIAEIRNQMARWTEEGKVSTGGGGDRLFLGAGDVVYFYFLSSGADGDPYFEQYMAHEYPSPTPGGRRTLRVCPVLSDFDDNYDCPGCRADIKAKPQMAMWMHVGDILRRTKREQDQFPVVSFKGQSFFHQKVDGPLLWDTSAWRDSPLNDIMFLYDGYGDLRAAQMELQTTGDGLSRRYKIYATPNSAPLDSGVYQADVAKIKPVRQLLMERLTANPVAATAPTAAAGDVVDFQPAFTAAAPSGGPALFASQPPAQTHTAAQPAVVTATAAPAAAPTPVQPAPFAPPSGAKSLF